MQVGSYLHSVEPSEGDSAGDTYLDILVVQRGTENQNSGWNHQGSECRWEEKRTKHEACATTYTNTEKLGKWPGRRRRGWERTVRKTGGETGHQVQETKRAECFRRSEWSAGSNAIRSRKPSEQNASEGASDQLGQTLLRGQTGRRLRKDYQILQYRNCFSWSGRGKIWTGEDSAQSRKTDIAPSKNSALKEERRHKWGERIERRFFPEMGEITVYATCNDVIQDKLRRSWLGNPRGQHWLRSHQEQRTSLCYPWPALLDSLDNHT